MSGRRRDKNPPLPPSILQLTRAEMQGDSVGRTAASTASRWLEHLPAFALPAFWLWLSQLTCASANLAGGAFRTSGGPPASCIKQCFLWTRHLSLSPSLPLALLRPPPLQPLRRGSVRLLRDCIPSEETMTCLWSLSIMLTCWAVLSTASARSEVQDKSQHGMSQKHTRHWQNEDSCVCYCSCTGDCIYTWYDPAFIHALI